MTTYNDKLRMRNMESRRKEREYNAIFTWACIATLIAGMLAGALFVQHCEAKYKSWAEQRAICLEEAQYYWNSWCDDNNNLVY